MTYSTKKIVLGWAINIVWQVPTLPENCKIKLVSTLAAIPPTCTAAPTAGGTTY